MQPVIMLQRYHQFKFWFEAVLNKLLQSFEACEVEPMLFVVKHSNLIGHDRIRSLKL